MPGYIIPRSQLLEHPIVNGPMTLHEQRLKRMDVEPKITILEQKILRILAIDIPVILLRLEDG